MNPCIEWDFNLQLQCFSSQRPYAFSTCGHFSDLAISTECEENLGEQYWWHLYIYIAFQDTLLVIGSISPHVGDAIDEEGNVEGDTEAEVEQNPERLPQAFIPVVPRHQHRDGYYKDGKQWHIQSGKH